MTNPHSLLAVSTNTRFVFSGGPGAGKTTTLKALEALGHFCEPESARQIIRRRLSTGLSRRPTARKFANEILAMDVDKYKKRQNTDLPVFYDRGVLDALYMLDTIGVLSTGRCKENVIRYAYNRFVFLFPPWQEIYCSDAERDQTFSEAIEVFEGLQAWYLKHAYKTIDVPKTSAAKRVSFILNITHKICRNQMDKQ